MVSTEELQSVLSGGGSVVDESNDKVGKVGQGFLDDQTNQPEWVTVRTGMFGGAESFVPIANATVRGSDVHVPFSKDQIKDAPRVEGEDGHLSQDEEAQLYRYYGMDYSEAPSDSGLPAGTEDTSQTTSGTVGRDTSGPTTDDAMTRSEERLNVGTEKVQTGKARLRKYVVTENVTKTVPVTREEVRVEREPITDANRDSAMSGGDITDEEHEVTLSEERAVVDKDTVPVERVRMDKDTVTENQQVSEEVRKEQIDTEGVDPGRS
ncbi:MAG: putative conserved domain protein [uncultured Nocardioidaceae bacterium]|uniref:Putative conserved domain protein n=1 Tax=uncultured Nocardioidaceae bacterium TaxID=253824 RepID=A0A6J4MH58_9ACTN|nr:MAG: putative conserved domain protein [uncultured Nocardioidaceae bacterium]